MRRRDACLLLLVVLLGLGCVVTLTRIARELQRGGRLTAELGRLRLTAVEPAVRARLRALPEPVFATYYVSPREAMPSRLKHLEERVGDLLGALHDAAPARFDFRIVDPTEDPDLGRFSARRGVSPFRVRTITRDAWDEREVWSTLTLQVGARPAAHLHGIVPETLPRLQALVLAHLDELERPSRARIVLAAPAGRFGALEGLLAAGPDGTPRADVLRVLPADDPFAAGADLVFWLAPEGVDAGRLAALDRFLEGGGAVVLAGSVWRLDARELEAGLVRVRPAPAARRAALRTLLAHLGLAAVEGRLQDERCERVLVRGAEHDLPPALRAVAPQQDFRGWPLSPNGTLSFTAATALERRAARLEERGTSARVLVTSSDRSFLRPPAADDQQELGGVPPDAVAVPRQALAMDLTGDGPLPGRVVVLGATTPFEDGRLAAEDTANRRLVDALVRELASADRRLAARARPPAPAPLPAFTAPRRAWLRLLCVGLGPLALLGVLVARRGGQPRPRFSGARVAGGLAALFVLVAVSRAVPHGALALDLTAERNEGPAAPWPGGPERPAIELVLSPRDAWPVPWRRGLDRLHALVARWAEEDGLGLTETTPEELDPAGREALRAAGIEPFRVTTRDADALRARTVWGTVRLLGGRREERVELSTARAFEDLETRLNLHLLRSVGRAPHIAMATDLPRPTSAEAHESYRQRGLASPTGVDVYHAARELLADTGYRVTHVDPRAPDLPPDTDLLVWLQPRRPAEAMYAALARHLHGGGRALVCVQHFNVQARQYRGAGFDVVYWPQPQYPDTRFLYFPDLGIELERKVLFDRLSTALASEAQLTGRGSPRSFERQDSALPFLVRVSAASFAPGATLTHDLTDQVFPWPSAIRWDEARLAELGLTARTLMGTSPRTWSYAWEGGWIPADLLAGPPETGFEGPRPLAVLFEGRFPRLDHPLHLGPGEPARPPAPWPEPGRGALLLLGASEPFKDHRLLDPTFRADHLLLNAVASLALPAELQEAATRRRVARGFGYVSPERRLAGRVLVVGAPAALLALAGAATLLLRRRSA